MNDTALLSAALATALGLTTPALAAGPAATPTTRRTTAPSLFNPSLFAYDKPAALTVECTTPTQDQIDYRHRPAIDRSPLHPTDTTAAPVTVQGIDLVHYRFTDATGDSVPVLLATPSGKSGPFPVVVAVHGLGSSKAQVIAQVAPALIEKGFAGLAPDLPLHGERPGDPHSLLPNFYKDPVGTFRIHRKAVIDVLQTIDLAHQLPDLDTSKGVPLVGYSLGSWIDSVAGALDPRVSAMVLMVGGATDIPLPALLVPQIAAVDPRIAIANFAGRPLLLLNGRDDHVVTPDMADRLYNAAPDPKERRWYESGHHLPQSAYHDAATWLAMEMKKG